MAFSNGAAFPISSGTWNRERSSPNTTTNFAYGDDLLVPTAGSTLKYYVNDVPVYTSEMAVADLYPYVNSYSTASSITINADYVTTKRLDITIVDYGNSVEFGGFGLNDQKDSLVGWSSITATLSMNQGDYMIFEDGVKVLVDTSYTPADGDVFSLEWTAPPLVSAKMFCYV